MSYEFADRAVFFIVSNIVWNLLMIFWWTDGWQSPQRLDSSQQNNINQQFLLNLGVNFSIDSAHRKFDFWPRAQKHHSSDWTFWESLPAQSILGQNPKLVITKQYFSLQYLHTRTNLALNQKQSATSKIIWTHFARAKGCKEKESFCNCQFWVPPQDNLHGRGLS